MPQARGTRDGAGSLLALLFGLLSAFPPAVQLSTALGVQPYSTAVSKGPEERLGDCRAHPW